MCIKNFSFGSLYSTRCQQPASCESPAEKITLRHSTPSPRRPQRLTIILQSRLKPVLFPQLPGFFPKCPDPRQDCASLAQACLHFLKLDCKCQPASPPTFSSSALLAEIPNVSEPRNRNYLCTRHNISFQVRMHCLTESGSLSAHLQAEICSSRKLWQYHPSTPIQTLCGVAYLLAHPVRPIGNHALDQLLISAPLFGVWALAAK